MSYHEYYDWLREQRAAASAKVPEADKPMAPEDVAFWNLILDNYGGEFPDALAIALEELAPADLFGQLDRGMFPEARYE